MTYLRLAYVQIQRPLGNIIVNRFLGSPDFFSLRITSKQQPTSDHHTRAPFPPFAVHLHMSQSHHLEIAAGKHKNHTYEPIALFAAHFRDGGHTVTLMSSCNAILRKGEEKEWHQKTATCISRHQTPSISKMHLSTEQPDCSTFRKSSRTHRKDSTRLHFNPTFHGADEVFDLTEGGWMMIQEGYMVDVSSHLGFIIPLFSTQIENSESIPEDMLKCDQHATKKACTQLSLGQCLLQKFQILVRIQEARDPVKSKARSCNTRSHDHIIHLTVASIQRTRDYVTTVRERR